MKRSTTPAPRRVSSQQIETLQAALILRALEKWLGVSPGRRVIFGRTSSGQYFAEVELLAAKCPPDYVLSTVDPAGTWFVQQAHGENATDALAQIATVTNSETER